MSELELEEPKWYVIHTFSSYEQMVLDNLNKCIKKNNLEDRILEVKIPMEEVIEEKNGKKKVVQRKMFPCYVLLKMRYTDNLWHTIVNTRGVTGFVGPQGRPIPLTDEEIAKMRLEKIKVDIKLEPGNKVKVISGPLDGFVGDVVEIDENEQKCRVNVEMFGRPTSVDLDYSQVELLD